MGSLTYSTNESRNAIAEKIRDEYYKDLTIEQSLKRFIDARIDNFEKEKKNYV
jgi:hypothetical protein